VKWGAIAGGVAGIGLSIWLLASFGLARVLDVIGTAGWLGVLAVIAFHPLQILCSALAWQEITDAAGERAPLRTYVVVRWIREAVNNLLPMAQVGGDVVAARLLSRRGLTRAPAIAGTLADLTLEIATQILFTALGLYLLMQSTGGGGIAHRVMTGLTVAVAAVGGLIAAQWLGFAGLIERLVLRIGRGLGFRRSGAIEGLDEAVRACYREPRRVALAAAWHLISWLLGGIEVCIALHFVGSDVGIAAGLIIESIGQAFKALGFAVPGALGIQEGGYIVIGRVFGLSPEVAIALSLLKRLREAALGIPALIYWRWRGEAAAVRTASSAEILP
jgi:putative membrane protein